MKNGDRKDLQRIFDAAQDYRYLLTKGYPVKQSLQLVASRYLLAREEMLLLYRCVHSSSYVEEVKRKLMCSRLDSYALYIDFYNVLTSVVNAISGGDVYLCDDCIPRDLRGAKVRKSDTPYIDKSLAFIAYAIMVLGPPKKVVAVVDKDISHSINHATMFKEILENFGVDCSYELTGTPDKLLIEYSKRDYSIVATSDSVIMIKCLKIAPVSYIVLRLLNVTPSINFAEILDSKCSECFDKIERTIYEHNHCNT